VQSPLSVGGRKGKGAGGVKNKIKDTIGYDDRGCSRTKHVGRPRATI